jgi:hypothetical protein
MRCALAAGLLIAMCASASAATVHRFRTSHQVTVQPAGGVCAPPNCYRFPGYPPLPRDAVRTLDASNYGGG